jgi:hypothetical protein
MSRVGLCAQCMILALVSIFFCPIKMNECRWIRPMNPEPAATIPQELYDILPDILWQIIIAENVYSQLKLVSKRFNTIAKGLYRAINTPTACGLYPRQLEAFTWMKKNSGQSMEIIADVSFGKTYLVLKYIEWKMGADSRPALVLVPPGIQNVWKTEVSKHMPAWYNRLIAKRKFITYADYNKLLGRDPFVISDDPDHKIAAGILAGRIVVCTSVAHLHILREISFQLCVADEIHRNLHALNILISMQEQHRNIVLIGANDAGVEFGQKIYKGSSEHLMIRPNIVYHFQKKSFCHKDILMRPAKHKVFITEIMSVKTKGNTYNFNNHIDSIYRKFVDGGGLFVRVRALYGRRVKCEPLLRNVRERSR